MRDRLGRNETMRHDAVEKLCFIGDPGRERMLVQQGVVGQEIERHRNETKPLARGKYFPAPGKIRPVIPLEATVSHIAAGVLRASMHRPHGMPHPAAVTESGDRNGKVRFCLGARRAGGLARAYLRAGASLSSRPRIADSRADRAKSFSRDRFQTRRLRADPPSAVRELHPLRATAACGTKQAAKPRSRGLPRNHDDSPRRLCDRSPPCAHGSR